MAREYLELPLIRALFDQVIGIIGNKRSYADLVFEMQDEAESEVMEGMFDLNAALYLEFGFIATDILEIGLLNLPPKRITELTDFIREQALIVARAKIYLETVTQILIQEGKYEEFLLSITGELSSGASSSSEETNHLLQGVTNRHNLLENLASEQAFEFTADEFDAVTEQLLKGNKPDVERYKKMR